MKKILSYIVLLSFLSLNNFTFVFAGNTNSLQTDKQNSIILLDNLEKKLDTTLGNLEMKIKDESIKEQIAEKQGEIEKYINEKQSEIKKETSSSDIKDIIEETTKVVTLKAVAGITPTTDVTESISSQIDISKNDLEKAQDTLIDSLKEGNKYTLMLKSKLTKENILKILNKFDKNISLNDMFEENGFSFFELEIYENSLLKKELLENIDSGEIPNNFLGIEIIKPELLQIGEIPLSQPFPSKEKGVLVGEEIDKLWGIKSYNTQKYLDKLSSKTKENGKKLQIGIIDTGISYNHSDLKNQISKSVAGYDFVNDDNDPLDDQGHGTHISGTIAGEVNGSGVFGVNPNVELVGLKICDSSGFCPTYGVLKALEYAKEKKIDILNMSLGAKGNVSTSPVCQAIKNITENGTIVISAAGNSNIDTSKFVPGGCSEAITVAAIDENNTRALFSNYGEKIDVAAPGVGVYSTYLNDGYKSLNGTSMATPHIVGVVSILKTFKPELTTKEIKEIFKNHSLPVQTENNKKIASGVDLDKILSSFGINIENKDTSKKEETKEELKNDIPLKDDENTTQNSTENQSGEITSPKDSEEIKSGEEFVLEDNSLLDESIGFIIQNPEEETTTINSVEDENQTGSQDETQDKEEDTTNIEQTSSLPDVNFESIDTSTPQETENEESNEIQNTYYNTLNIGQSVRYNFTNANKCSYSFAPNGIASSVNITSQGFTISANSPGNTTLYIRYNGKEIHRVYVTVNTPVKNLTVSTNNISLQNGNSSSFSITNGNGGYTVTSSNTNIAQISGSNTSWNVYAKGIGNTTINIKDSKGKTASINIGVSARNLTLSTYALDVDTGVNGYITITNGNGGYSVIKKNNNISVNLSGTRVTVYSNVVGTHTLQIKDSAGKVVIINIRVIAALQVSNFNSSIQKNIGETISYSVTSGNGNYTVSSSNTSIATVSPGYLGTSGVITAKGVGSATITLRDGSGKSVSLNLVVKSKTYAQINTLQYNSSINKNGMGGLYFEVDGKYKEVGVEYYYGTNIYNINKHVLSLESDNVYSVAYDLTCKTSSNCKINIKPYVIDIAGNKIYYKTQTLSNSYIAVGYGNGGYAIANDGGEEQVENGIVELEDKHNFVLPDDYKEIENNNISEEKINGESEENNYTENTDDEEGVEINGLTDDIKASWKQIKADAKNFAEKNKGLYDGSIDAINDQIAELKSLLDPETYKKLVKELKKLTLKVINGEYEIKVHIEKLKKDFAEAYAILDTAWKYLSELSYYESEYYGSYLTISGFATGIGPGKVKGAKAVKKMTDKAEEVIVKGILSVVKKKISHIMTVEFKVDSKGNKKFSGVHSNKAIVNHKYGARIEADSTNLTRKKNNQPYEAKVFAKDETGKEYLKDGGSGYSTFFPDNWDEAKIIDEVSYAVKNNKGLVDTKNPSSNLYKGFSKDGTIEIHFAYDNNQMRTFYPVIKK